MNVNEKKKLKLWLPDGWVVPYWYPGCSWQSACYVYLPLNNYFLQVKCSQVFKSALCFTKITVHLLRQLSNRAVIPATNAAWLLQHQTEEWQKIFASAIQTTHLNNYIYIGNNNLRLENHWPPSHWYQKSSSTMMFKFKIKSKLNTWFLVKEVYFIYHLFFGQKRP